jgi:hypothetical protein
MEFDYYSGNQHFREGTEAFHVRAHEPLDIIELPCSALMSGKCSDHHYYGRAVFSISTHVLRLEPAAWVRFNTHH